MRHGQWGRASGTGGENLLEKKYTPNNICDVCDYNIKAYYNVYKESIDALINIAQNLDYTCRGIYFWSFDLKHKPKLYNFNEDIIIDVYRKTKDNPEFKTFDDIASPNEEKVRKASEISEYSVGSSLYSIYSADSVDSIDSVVDINDNIKILWLSKTDEPDVYNVYNNENTLSSLNIGIALVPSLQVSKMIRMSFREKNAATSIKYRCKFNLKFNKWEPFEQIIQ